MTAMARSRQANAEYQREYRARKRREGFKIRHGYIIRPGDLCPCPRCKARR